MTPYHSRPIIAPNRRSSPWPSIVLLIVVAGILGYYGYNSHRATTSTLDDSTKVAGKFLDYLARGNYTSADSLLTASGRSENSATTLGQEMGVYIGHYGALLRSSQTYSAPRNIGGLDTCKLAYKLQFQHGTANMQMILVRDSRGWSIDSFTLA